MSRLESVEINALGWKEETSEAEERRFRVMQKQDKFCVPILWQIRDNGGKELQEGILVENGLLYHREGNREDGSTRVQLVVPGKLIPEVLFLNHDHALGGGALRDNKKLL